MTSRYFPENIRPNLKDNEKFEDTSFPNNMNSLFNENNPIRGEAYKPDENKYKNDPEGLEKAKKFYDEYLSDWKKEKEEIEDYLDKNILEWKRISEIISFEIDEERKNCPLKQAALGDCYLIAFLRRFKDIKPKQYSALIGYYDFNKGYYEINFYDKNGDNIIVYVDDYILVYDGKIPYFASVQEKDTFIVGRYLLIEKAFAKMNGSYFNINGGYNGIDASYALTGIRPIKLGRSFFSLDEIKIYNIIRTIFITENLMISGTKNKISFKGLYGNHMYSILYIEEYDDNNKTKIIELQNPWGRNKQEDKEQFALNLDEKHKNIEDNLKKYFRDNIKIGKIKILIKNFKDNFDLLEVVVFNKISEENKKEIEKNYIGTFPWPPVPEGGQKIKGLSKRKGILDNLGINEENQKKFFSKYKQDIDKGLSDLNNYFIKFGTCAKAFNELMDISDNPYNPDNSDNSLSGWIQWALNPFKWFNK